MVVKPNTKEVESNILSNISKHDPYLSIDYENSNNTGTFKSDDKEENNEFFMLNPYLIDVNMGSN